MSEREREKARARKRERREDKRDKCPYVFCSVFAGDNTIASHSFSFNCECSLCGKFSRI